MLDARCNKTFGPSPFMSRGRLAEIRNSKSEFRNLSVGGWIEYPASSIGWVGGIRKAPGEFPGLFVTEFLMRNGTNSVALNLDLDRSRLRLLALWQGENHLTVREPCFDFFDIY
jgi:hypothetical protein